MRMSLIYEKLKYKFLNTKKSKDRTKAFRFGSKLTKAQSLLSIQELTTKFSMVKQLPYVTHNNNHGTNCLRQNNKIETLVLDSFSFTDQHWLFFFFFTYFLQFFVFPLYPILK